MFSITSIQPYLTSLEQVTSLKDGYIEMGSSGLMLNVITPLQKFSKGGTTISDVLRQRFEDLFHRTISSHTLTQVENVYTGKKEDRIKLQQVTILAELFDDARERPFATSALSDIVTNSKGRKLLRIIISRRNLKNHKSAFAPVKGMRSSSTARY